jgi:PKD repeat protein
MNAVLKLAMLFVFISTTSTKKVFSQIQVTTKVRTFDFRINAAYTADFLNSAIYSPYYQVRDTGHFICVPMGPTLMPPAHFIKKGGTWFFENTYPSAGMMGPAAVARMDTLGSWAMASTGDEGFTALGDLHVVKTVGEQLQFQKISTNKEYFGDVAAGDVNNDGRVDVVSYGGRYPNNLMQPFIQNSNGQFIADTTYISGAPWFIGITPIQYAVGNGGYSVAVDKLFDTLSPYPVIVKGQYSTSPEARFGLAFFTYNSATNKYDSVKTISQVGAQQDTLIGLKTISVGDLNNDGFKDLVSHFETPSGSIDGLQIYINDRNGNFTAGQSIYFYANSRNTILKFSDIVVYDINKDGYNDILLSPVAGGIMNDLPNFYILNGNVQGQVPQGFYLKNYIYINDGTGNFNRISNDIKIFGTIPYFLRVLPIGNQLRYAGFTFPTADGNPLGPFLYDSIRLIDVTVNFCNNLIRPRFSTSNYTFCKGDTLTLSITNVNQGDSLKWYYGSVTDFSNTSIKRFTDTATVFVTRTDSVGCVISSDTIRLTNYPLVRSSFSINSSSQCLTGNNFGFTNTSSIASGSLTQHAWSFGDGGTATTLNATRSYAAPGTYTVKLVSTSNEGCKDSTTQQVVVNPMPAAGYTINSNAQCLTNNNFNFTNTANISSGTLTHAWNFGDGGTATTLNAIRSYTTPGTYTVKLVSTSNNGCKDSTTQQVVVHPMPSTAFSINSAGQCLTGNSFTFTNNSVITTGSLTQHSWNFGDGGTATTLNATRSYTAPGAYAVKLVATSNNGCKDSTTRSVTVHPMPLSIFSANTAIQCLTGNTFQFTNNSMISNGTLSSNWSFGNGATSTLQSPMHSYAAVGSYTVKLVSTSNNGCKDSTTRDMRVDPSPTANLTVAPYRSIHPGLLTAISATITPAGNYQYTWYRNSTIIPNKTTTVVDSIGYRLWSGAYKMAVANPTPLLPCTYTTPEVVIGDSASAKLFIYPSPNMGQFKVTYYSAANTRYQIVITDTKGAVLYRRQHEVTNRYQLIDINLTGANRGLYLLQIQDPSGVPLTSGKFVIH